jgi:hypothetical protein
MIALNRACLVIETELGCRWKRGGKSNKQDIRYSIIALKCPKVPFSLYSLVSQRVGYYQSWNPP